MSEPTQGRFAHNHFVGGVRSHVVDAFKRASFPKPWDWWAEFNHEFRVTLRRKARRRLAQDLKRSGVYAASMQQSGVERGDRVRGVLVGLALGDALGAPVEFDGPAAIGDHRDELFELPGGGSFDWAPGEFTDDTQMALVLARHLDQRGGSLDQDELALDFAAWMDGAKDVGVQTRKVLTAVAARESWREAVARLPANAEGNGCIMRTAPVALVARNRDDAAQLARTQAMLTHPSPTCLEASAAYAWLLTGVLETGILDVDAAVTRFPGAREALERSAAVGRPRMSGWVIDTLAGALWAVRHAERFEDALWRAVSLGYDADTVGAVAGALAGARWGLEAIPKELAARLTSEHPSFSGTYPDDLVEMAELLAARALPRTVSVAK